ncbi:unnamed protein product [Clavelina lepadiformis]|uniref:Uncharacterized protein n=1 Tax=Clavelina lepadiformis TaxID=159417 RepID=A0ABP0FMZ7_CLALP
MEKTNPNGKKALSEDSETPSIDHSNNHVSSSSLLVSPAAPVVVPKLQSQSQNSSCSTSSLPTGRNVNVIPPLGEGEASNLMSATNSLSSGGVTFTTTGTTVRQKAC